MSMTCWLMRRTTSLFAGSSCSIGCVPGNVFAMRVALGLTVYAEQVSGVTTAGSDPEYIRFASKITLTVGGHGCLCCALLPVTVASGPQIPTQLQETARIRPPVLTIEYADRQVASFATDSSFYAASVEFTVRFRLTAPCALRWAHDFLFGCSGAIHDRSHRLLDDGCRAAIPGHGCGGHELLLADVQLVWPQHSFPRRASGDHRRAHSLHRVLLWQLRSRRFLVRTQSLCWGCRSA